MEENNQSKLSKEWIIDALIYLMKRKSFEKITITEITKKAGVARLTFYRHFENKEQVLIARSQYLFENYFDEIKTNNKKIDIHQALLLCFHYWQQDSEVIALLEKNHLTYLLESSFYTFLGKIIENYTNFNTLNSLQKSFIIGGLTHSMIFWISSKSTQAPEEISKNIVDLFDLDYIYSSTQKK